MTSPASGAPRVTPLPADPRPAVWGSILRFLGWAGFSVLVLYAVLLGGSWYGIYWLDLRLLTLAIVAAVLAAWFVGSLWRPGWRPSTAIWPALVLPVVALSAAMLASSLPRMGLEYVAWAVLLVALYLLLVRILAAPYGRARIGALAASLCLVIGGAYLVISALAWLDWWDLVGRLAVPPLRPHTGGLTYRNPSAVATIVVISAFIAWAGLPRGRPGRRPLLLAVSIVAGAVVVVTGSRSAWLALAGTAILVGGLWLVITQRRRGAAGIRVERRLVPLALAACIGLAAITLALAPSVSQRILGAGDGGRSVYFATAMRMFEDAPLMGTGPGTWAVKRAAYTEPGELDWYVTHAHDMYLQGLAETGLVGATAGLAAAAAAVRLLWIAFRGGDPERRRWTWGALVALSYLGIASLVDNYSNMPAVILLGAIPVAVLDATAPRGGGTPWLVGSARSRVVTAARAVFWILCLGALAILARTESLAMDHVRAVVLIDDGQWVAAKPLVTSLTSTDPEMTTNQVLLGQVASATADWATARDAYRRAAVTDDLPASWLGLAQAQLELGEPPGEVSDSLLRALRIGSQQPGIVYAAASLFDRAGLIREADAHFAAAIAAMPSLAADPHWTDDRLLAPRFPGILEQAIQLDGLSGWQVALFAGDVERARALAEDRFGAASREALVVGAWAGDDEALARLREQTDAAPRDTWLLDWASLIAARAHDEDEAERLRQLALFNWEGGTLPGFELRRDPGQGLGSVPAGTRGAYYGEWLYRRTMPIRQLPPGLPQLVYVDLEGQGPP